LQAGSGIRRTGFVCCVARFWCHPEAAQRWAGDASLTAGSKGGAPSLRRAGAGRPNHVPTWQEKNLSNSRCRVPPQRACPPRWAWTLNERRTVQR